MAERLKDLLEDRRMEPMELVRAMDVTKATVYFILDGTTGADKVRASTVMGICHVLKTSPDYLLYGKGLRDTAPVDERLAELMRLYNQSEQAIRDALVNVAKAMTHSRS